MTCPSNFQQPLISSQPSVPLIPLSPSIREALFRKGITDLIQLYPIISTSTPASIARDFELESEHALSLYKILNSYYSAHKNPAFDSDSTISSTTPPIDSSKNVSGFSMKSASELLTEHALEIVDKIPTGIRSLDNYLGGGFSVGQLYEIAGIAGIGKTQFVLQAAANTILPKSHGGLGAACIYIDTEGGFTPSRFKQLFVSRFNNGFKHSGSGLTEPMITTQLSSMENSLNEIDQVTSSDVSSKQTEHIPSLLEKSSIASQKFFKSIFKNFYFLRVYSAIQLLSIIHLLPKFIESTNNVKLCIIDSIAFPFRAMSSQVFTSSSSSNKLASLKGNISNAPFALAQRSGNTLLTIANSQKLSVIVTNHITTSPLTGLIPALGKSWAQIPTVRLLCHPGLEQQDLPGLCISVLKNSLDNRLSSDSTHKTFRYVIQTRGCVDIKDIQDIDTLDEEAV